MGFKEHTNANKYKLIITFHSRLQDYKCITHDVQEMKCELYAKKIKPHKIGYILNSLEELLDIFGWSRGKLINQLEYDVAQNKYIQGQLAYTLFKDE
jgi:hypothetical protein